MKNDSDLRVALPIPFVEKEENLLLLQEKLSTEPIEIIPVTAAIGELGDFKEIIRGKLKHVRAVKQGKVSH